MSCFHLHLCRSVGVAVQGAGACWATGLVSGPAERSCCCRFLRAKPLGCSGEDLKPAFMSHMEPSCLQVQKDPKALLYSWRPRVSFVSLHVVFILATCVCGSLHPPWEFCCLNTAPGTLHTHSACLKWGLKPGCWGRGSKVAGIRGSEPAAGGQRSAIMHSFCHQVAEEKGSVEVTHVFCMENAAAL